MLGRFQSQTDTLATKKQNTIGVRRTVSQPYPRTMTSLVSSCEMQALQSHSTRNFSQSLCRKRRVAPIRSRSFMRLGP